MPAAATKITAALFLALLAGTASARDAAPVAATQVPPSGVIGVDEAHLSPQFWVSRLGDADQVVLDRAAITAQNRQLQQTDDSVHDLAGLPGTLDRSQVAGWIQALSSLPGKPLYDVTGTPVPRTTLDALVENLALDGIPEQQPMRFGMVVHRADLRTFPTSVRVFNSDDDTDIDRFQESAVFPGTPVGILHASHDGQWLFVVSPRYAAWIEKRHVAEGSKAEVFDYLARSPFRIVTGAKVDTVHTREQPQLSELQLDMGTRIPLADTPPAQLVNGQHPYTSHVLELPIRAADGSLRFAPALLQKNTDTSDDYLPLTKANLIRQAFKFLGERYGWGHSYNGRDCSGFVSEVYRSMGVQLPRNTSAQSVSPALNRIHFEPTDGRDKRMAAVAGLQVGDLVYIPGHVMMVVGRIGDVPYVIHDTNGGSYLGADGKLQSMHLNAVSLTPLSPLMFNARQSYIDRITNIVRIRP